MKLKQITFEQHKEFGRMSKIFSDLLVTRTTTICNNASSKAEGEKLAIHEKKAYQALSILRDNLEEILFRDYPGSQTNIYYGAR